MPWTWSAGPTTNQHGTFVLSRTDTAREFTCGRCRKRNVATIQAEWTQPNATKPTMICNGCCGFLRSGKASASTQRRTKLCANSRLPVCNPHRGHPPEPPGTQATEGFPEIRGTPHHGAAAAAAVPPSDPRQTPTSSPCGVRPYCWPR